MSMMRIVILAIASAVVCAAATAQDDERAVLMELYTATAGGSWQYNAGTCACIRLASQQRIRFRSRGGAGWGTSDDHCGWAGVVCDASGHVSKL